jgi:hypothetical protein
MSKWIATLLVMGLLFGTNTYAQNKPIACQDDAYGGLIWRDGRWQTATFTNVRRFILVLQGKNLTQKSASMALGGGGDIGVDPDTKCLLVFGGKISCSDEFGGYLMFDPETMKGAISQLIGGTSLGEKRDTLGVRAFTCQQF